MKLASLKSGRDGVLLVVNKDLSQAVKVPEIALTLQSALDRWSECEPKLAKAYADLNAHKVASAFSLKTGELAAPLPRAYQWVDASAYVNHVQLVRKSRGVEMPAEFWTDPLMYQGCSDSFMGCNDPIELADESWGIDFEAEVGVITDDVPMGSSPAQAARHIKLITLINDVSLRAMALKELQKGFGFLQCKPASAFSPVFVTPDELGDAWKDNKVHLPLVTHHNGQLFGKPNAGVDMTFDFARLVSHAALTRHLCAGTVLGSGTVSNTDRSVGSSCLVEKRMLETLEHGAAQTPFMKFGDTVKIEMLDAKGSSIFGAIEQKLVKYSGAR